ncbi:MAG: pyridoxal-phosphate-dependent aminotransferase family protein [Thermoprotei archaeon]
MKYDDEDLLLLTPGPVELHPRVLKALSSPVRYHREKSFLDDLMFVTQSVSKLEGTDNLTVPITGSGTAAMDAAVSSMVRRSSKVLSFINGVFSERLYNISRYYSDSVTPYYKEWGKAITREDVRSALEDKEYDFVTIVHNETSTGVLNPMDEIMEEINKRGLISIVDGVTSVGGDRVEVDKWGIDAMITASQKCLGGPPGMSFVTLSDRALSLIKKIDRGQSYYVDVRNYIKDGKIDIPFTTATPLVIALKEAINMIYEEGLDRRISRHRLMGKAVRSGAQAMGLELLAERGYESNTVTAIKIPEKADQVVSQGKRYGVLFAGGQGKLAGKILRIGHMNIIGEREVLTGISVLDAVLNELGIEHSAGSGTLAAQQEFSMLASE